MLSLSLLGLESSLRRQLSAPNATEYLHQLRRHDELVACFPTWETVLQYMHGKVGTAEQKNAVLRVMLVFEARQFRDVERTAMLAIFMPALRHLAARCQTRDADERDDLTQNLLTYFLEAADWLRRSGRRENLAGALMRQTFHLLYEGYRRQRRVREHELRLPASEQRDDDLFDALRDSQDDPEFGLKDCCRGLQDLVRRRVIHEADYHLIVGTLIYGHPIPEYARLRGLSPEACKKARQRALENIRRVHERIESDVSPSDPLGGLFSNEG